MSIISKKKLKHAAKKAHYYSKGPFWFVMGFVIAGITIVSICVIVFSKMYADRVIPGVFVDNINVSGKTRQEVEDLYNNKNKITENSTFTLKFDDLYATASAKDLDIGYDTNLISNQVMSLGKNSNFFANVYIILSSYLYGTTLHAPYTFDSDKFADILKPLQQKAYKAPVDAQFAFDNNRVTAFKQSQDGVQLDTASAQKFMDNSVEKAVKSESKQNFSYVIPAIVLEPDITTEEANSFGIVEEIGSGTSLFYHSIPNRVHNIQVASSRVSGILVKPGEEFSFDKNLGDVSKATGYASAYVIQNGRTVLGDGGGVCQVSTTLFRAILNAGLPITERHAHAYRVGYYEEDSPAGLDATVFYPSVDLKFVNNTGNYILVQSNLDLDNMRLTYTLYGKKDGRTVDISKPAVTGYAPAPDPLYQDDPTLPKGTTKQVDFAAAGATAIFNRIVKDKNGKVVIDEKYVSRYTPWRAVFLVGTG